jgi:hypothetical protein
MRLSYEGDYALAMRYLGKAQQELERLQQRLDVSGRENGTFQHVLDENSYCYGYILSSGIKAVHIVANAGAAEETSQLLTKYPDFVSGVVIDGIYEQSVGSQPARINTYYPTAQTCKLHRKEVGSVPYAPVKLPRLAVDVWGAFDELKSHSPAVILTQYSRLKPTMYSGKMRKVVQAVMGFGKRQKKSIYDNLPPHIRSDLVPIPPTLYEISTAATGIQVRFDYRFPRTHGIVTAADGKLWLIEIGQPRGVLAMPLPLVWHTDDPQFRQKLERLPDPDGLTLIDEFGGFPSGEGFPAGGTELEAWIRAGRVQRLVSASDMYDGFYRHSPYSQAMGWAFSESGHEAHNTAYNFDDDTGVQYGVHYMLPLQIGNSATFAPSISAEELKTSFQPFRADLGDAFDAAIWKLDHMNAGQLADLKTSILTQGIRAALAELDALVLTPIASATAHLSKVSQGNIYWPTRLSPQIKFPEYTLGFLLSHDMRTDRHISPPEPRCDTTMHVFFIGDELKWCKFFKDDRGGTPGHIEGDSDFDINWNPVGDFHRTTTSGAGTVPAMFYTNDIDDRRETWPGVTTAYYKRRDKGWISIGPAFFGLQGPSDFDNGTGPLTPDFPEGGVDENHKLTISKNKWFSYETWGSFRGGAMITGAIAVPFFDRCAYYCAKLDFHTGGQDTYGYRTGLLSSPWIGHYYRSVNTTCGILDGGQHILAPEGQYFTPVDDTRPYQAFQDIADSGDWVNHCAPAASQMYGDDAIARLPLTWKGTVSNVPAQKTLTVHLVANESRGPIQTYTETRFGDDASLWETLWFIPSPDEGGNTQYIQETQNALGLSDAVVCEKDLKAPGSLVLGSPNIPVMRPDLANVTFIGVVDA